MIKWIDIVSPTLRRIHQTWVGFRGSRLMVHVNDYNKFVGHAPVDLSLSVILPGDGASPVIKHAGAAVREAYPNVWAGLRFDDIVSSAGKQAITIPFHKVATARQPDARRSAWRLPEEMRDYEQLLLPFDNDHLRVCVIHAVFDLGRLQRMAA